MPEGTYNFLTDRGTVIKDPPMIIEIDGIDEEWGMTKSGVGVETAVGYALMRKKGITLGEKDEWYAENGHPDVIVHHDTGPTVTYEWEDDVDDYVTASKSMEGDDEDE